MELNTKFSKREEVANAVSHFLGALLAVAGLVLMIYHSVVHGNAWHLVSTSVFGGSMIILYLSSTLTHILPMGKAKDLFFNIDRIAIYFLIAATYTPIALITLNGPFGWIIFGIEWGLAIFGTILILTRPGNFNSGVNTFYVISYAVMGWLFLIAIVPIIDRLPVMGWLWILIGGLCYTLGIVFFKLIKFPYHHLVWHLLVIAGSLSHFFAVFFYMIPR
ncbi:MAG: hemolysin III family protein [Bacteroidales bacterium]|nr:hemolysin III family protein [Bacteroidales bacterium]